MATEIRGFDAVRRAARDVANYSSDLQGDRDVRTYRQLPLEVDPPQHHKYRVALSPLFVKKAVDGHAPALRAIAHDLVANFVARGGGEVVTELALPMVVQCLGVLYNRPQDVAEWLSWGPDVWLVDGVRSPSRLDSYLAHVFDDAVSGSTPDVWTFVSHIEIDDRRLTRQEMYGIASVLLAGGRDTVVKLLTGALWHLASRPADLAYLHDRPEARSLAINEWLRFFSPLPRMERVPSALLSLAESERNPAEFVTLSFVSGNHDASVFEDPDVIDIRRPRTVNLAFGAGPHTCVGNHVAETEARIFVDEFLTQVENCEVDDTSNVVFGDDQGVRYVAHFERLNLKVRARSAPSA